MEYQRINVVPVLAGAVGMAWWLCPVVSTAPVPLCGGVGVGKACGARFVRVVFGALLGPEATGPATIVLPGPFGRPLCGGVLGFLVFLSLPIMRM